MHARERRKEEREEMEEVRCFLTNVRWSTEVKEGDTGITWLELYALYMCKGAGEKAKKKQEDNPLTDHISLQKALSTFKIRCRRIRTFCIEKEDEEQNEENKEDKDKEDEDEEDDKCKECD